MKTKLALTAFAAAIAVFSQGAFAQASSPTRAEVKAEAKTANKAPKGDAATGGTPAKGSNTTKEARKAETQAAAKSGNLQPGGDAMTKEGAGALEDVEHDQGSAQGRYQGGDQGRRHHADG